MKAMDLAARGYFPVQLPPAFSTRSFAAKMDEIAAKWLLSLGESVVPTSFHRYSVARSSYHRRVTAIVNPFGFYRIAKAIETYWTEIENHFSGSDLSRSKPALNNGLRAIELTKFSELYEDRILASSGYRYVLITDISSYFPTIYTHTIPWALHGKEVAKKKKEKTPQFFGNILDAASTSLQDNQTVGLPIGPDTSHIISEIIGVAIDKFICDELGYPPPGFRYVDDFSFFFDTREEAERALAAVVKAAAAYELQTNASKTRIVETRDLVQDSWKYTLKKTQISSARRLQRDDIHHYFEMLFSLESRFKDESLVKYGLKQISSTIIKKSNWRVFEAYLLKCGYGFPNSLQIVAQLLCTYSHHGYDLDTVAIHRFCVSLLASNAASRSHSEVAWCLWICKAFSLAVSAKTADDILRMNSDICSVMLLDLHHRDLVDGALDISLIATLANKNALEGPNWLLAYEAGKRKWLGNRTESFIRSSHLFQPIFASRVSFYDENAVMNPIFDLRAGFSADDVDFDGDGSIEDDFEFDDMDEEYFDSSNEDEDDGEAGDAQTAGGLLDLEGIKEALSQLRASRLASARSSDSEE